MLRRLLSLAFVAAIGISGCTGSAEIKAGTEGKSLSQEDMQKAMEESQKHMPKEMQGAKMPTMMPDMTKAPGAAGAPAPPAGAPASTSTP